MKEKKPSLIKRDSHNRPIDPKEGHRIAGELMGKFLAEKAREEKDNRMMPRGMKRDIVVHLAVTILPRVNGVSVIGEEERDKQFCFELPARALPIRNHTAIKAFSELCHLGKQTLMRLGLVTP